MNSDIWFLKISQETEAASTRAGSPFGNEKSIDGPALAKRLPAAGSNR
ncbi:hypothetical protein [Rhizobium rhizophilum]|nr:hypothetical protein [Rhizobium rhizophilum]